MDEPPPGIDLSESRVPLLVGLISSTWVFAMIAVVLRIVARRLTKQALWWDDGFIIAALTLTSGGTLLVLAWTIPHGLGRHIWAGPPDAAIVWVKSSFIDELLYTLVLCCVKFSILAFYWRVFNTSTIRPAIYVLTAVVACWGIAVVLITILGCIPTSSVWNRFLDPSLAQDCRVNQLNSLIGNAVPNIVTDVVLIILPMPFIWRLQLRRSQKVALTNVFVLGALIVAVSVTRAVLLPEGNPTDPDVTWSQDIGQLLLSFVEVNVAIVCACLPSLRPLLNMIMTGSVSRNAPSVGPASRKMSGRPWVARGRDSIARRHQDGASDSRPFTELRDLEV